MVFYLKRFERDNEFTDDRLEGNYESDFEEDEYYFCNNGQNRNAFSAFSKSVYMHKMNYPSKKPRNKEE